VKSLNTNNINKLRQGAARAAWVFSFLLLVVLVPSRAMAQAGGDAVRQYIERTDELLQWAQGLVRETESEPARRVLQQAVELHQRSLGLMERGMMAESLGLARRARDAVWHAVRVAREASGLDERIRVRAERFQDEHRNLVERATDARNRSALDFLERARSQAERARDIYQQGDLKLAWNLMETAGDLMHRAARLLAESGGPERLTSELDRTRELIDRQRERLGAGATDAQSQLLAEAEEALQRALAARDEEQPGRALQLVGLATSLARRAGDGDAATGPGVDAVRRQMERFDARAERVADRIREANSPPARKMFERARQQRDRAAEALGGGDRELALRLIRAAHELLDQADEILG
jgi:tetratricopeptide (TPR) repeat protein